MTGVSLIFSGQSTVFTLHGLQLPASRFARLACGGRTANSGPVRRLNPLRLAPESGVVDTNGRTAAPSALSSDAPSTSQQRPAKQRKLPRLDAQPDEVRKHLAFYQELQYLPVHCACCGINGTSARCLKKRPLPPHTLGS
jgi:hypothetical protein